MVYDDKKAWEKLKEAMKTAEECDPTGDDCGKCSISKPMEMVAHDSGVKVVASVCSMVSALKDVCYEPNKYKYRED